MNFSAPCAKYIDGVCSESLNPPWYYSHKNSLIDGIPDEYLALASPIIAYWVLSLFFHYLDMQDWKSLEKYRINESVTAASRNRVSKSVVVGAVIFQQILQTALGLVWLSHDGRTKSLDHAGRIQNIGGYLALLGLDEATMLRLGHFVYWWAVPIFQFLVAIFVIDTWQYFLHRYMHMNKFLYRHFHSWHHRLSAPYAFGALYNHPVEGFLLDSLGTVIAESVSGMSTRQAALLFCVATFKTVDDHCGYSLPWDPLQMLTQNNADYHDIHHQAISRRPISWLPLTRAQTIGIKSNFAQPFFVHWDTMLGTQMTRQELEIRKKANREKRA
ncbi:unnamed protein product [Mycena citricolor]|uniref:Fatty acid hydroxylase domain-containing protein n=1 Tax=Mycena citricolor TaxID=2018698 RepID=A0AAD2Q478_9AGAR|nr:unnamed protein product [Mycena citricolor]